MIFFKRFAKILLLLSAFVPLVLPPEAFPFVFSKALAFRVIVELAIICFLISLFSGQNNLKNIFKNKIVIFVSIFFLIVFLSSVSAIDSYRAFWGDAERMEGFFGLIHYFIFFLMTAVLFEKKDWLNFFKLNIITGFILFVFALFQFLSIKTFALIPVSDRPGSFLGNPDFLGIQFLFISAFSALIFLNSVKKSFWSIFSGIMFLLSLAGIFLSGTRSALVGLVAGAIFALFHLLINRESSRRIKKISLGLLVVLAVFGSIFWFSRSADIWQKVPGLNRLADISLSDQTVQTRLISLGIAKDAVVKKPLLGFGQDNYNVAFYSNFNPEYLQYEETWFDRAHNKLADVAVMNGLLGLLAYLGIFAAAFLTIRRMKGENYTPVILGALFTAYFIGNLFTFDQINSYILFFSILAFIAYISDLSQAPLSKGTFDSKSVKAAIAILIGLAIFSLIKWNFIPYKQMKTFVSAIESGNAETIYKKSDSLLFPYTLIQNTIRYSLLEALSGNNLLTDKRTADLSNKAVKAYEEVAFRHHYDLQARLNLIQFYNSMAPFGDNEKLAKIQEISGELVILAPRHPVPYYLLATVLAKEGKREQALATIDKAVELNPELGKAYYYKGIVLSMLADKAEARKNILKALELGMREISETDRNNIIQIIGESDFEKYINKANI